MNAHEKNIKMVLTLQNVYANTKIKLPTKKLLRFWLNAVFDLVHHEGFDDLALRINVRYVDVTEITMLNEKYRQKFGATNILTFSYDDKRGKFHTGDLVVCVPIIFTEAKEQKKDFFDHFAHLIVHGALHLLEYDHETQRERNYMEKQEILILQKLGIASPY